jgi:endoglucanase
MGGPPSAGVAGLLERNAMGKPFGRRELLAGAILAGAGVGAVAFDLPGIAAGRDRRRPARGGADPLPLDWDGAVHSYRYGVALAGLEFGENVFPGRLNAEIQAPPADRYAYYASKGLRSIRLPYLWERFQPDLFGDIDGKVDLLSADSRLGDLRYKDLVRRQLDLAHQHGMKVLLDPHNYGARAIRRDGQWLLTGGTGRSGRFAIGSNEVPVAAFADFVVKLAREYGGHPALMGLDIMNEPVKMPGEGNGWLAAAQAAVTATRHAGSNVLIFVEGYRYANPFTWRTNNPRLHELKDPANRIVFSAHLYFDADHSGRYLADEGIKPRAVSTPARAQQDIGEFFDWLEEHGFNGHVGEFGAPDLPEWRPIVQGFVDQCASRGVLMHAWADWPKPSKYPLQLNPQGGPDKQLVTILARAQRALITAR